MSRLQKVSSSVSVCTHTAGVPLVVAGAEHVAGDAAGRGAAVALLAAVVGPHVDLDLHEVAGLGAALAERAPARHRHPVVHVLLAALRQADRLDVVIVLHVVLQSQDGNIVPL